jgi:hypothetical protein
MAQRITVSDLRNLVARVNREMGTPAEYNGDTGGPFRANVGHYRLDQAYGGYRLTQVVSEGGAERDITGRGTARETYHRIHAFLDGAEAVRRAQ